MGKKWSASKVGTMADCPLKYRLSYIEGWKRFPEQNVLAFKGLAFHETVEHYNGSNKDELRALLEENIKKYEVDTSDFDIHEGLERFFVWWEKCIEPMKSQGYKVYSEKWSGGFVEGEEFCGKLDLILESPDKVEILDYKTSKTMNPSSYKNQLVLYAYMEGQKRGWGIKEIAEKISLKLFFPIAKIDGEHTLEERALKSYKEIKLTEDMVREVIDDYYKATIKKIHATDWNTCTEFNMSHSCSWCPYCGAGKNGEFIGCQATVDAGLEMPEGSYIGKAERKIVPEN